MYAILGIIRGFWIICSFIRAILEPKFQTVLSILMRNCWEGE